MATLTVTVVAGKELGKRFALASADARRVMRSELNSAMLLFASTEKAALKKTFMRHTGKLEHVVLEPITSIVGEMVGRVGSTAVYARVQEKGGTIRPKHSANLTIPLPAMLTPQRKVARGTARDVISNPGEFGFAGTFFRSSILFGKTDSGAVPLFALKKSVTLPPRPTWEPSIKIIEPIYEARMHSALAALIKQ